jgi:MFS family permease
MEAGQPTHDDPRIGAGPRHAASFALGLLTLVYTLNFVDRQVLSILLEPVKRDLGASDAFMGFLAGPAFAVFYTLAGVPIARWADRGIRRDIIALGLALWSGMTAVSALARTATQLALARVGVGIGEAACSPAAHSLIADLFPKRERATAMAVYSTGIHAGILLGLVLGGWVEQRFGWRTAFLVAGLPGVGLAAIVRAGIREPARAAHLSTSGISGEPFARSLLNLWRIRSLRWLAAGATLTSLVGYAFAAWSPALLMRVHSFGTAKAGLWIGLASGLGGAAGTLLGGALADRLQRRDPRWPAWISALGALLAAPCFACFAQARSPGPALLALVPALVFQAVWLGPIFGLTQSLADLRLRALAASLLLLSINLLGLGVGPQLVGLLNDAWSASLGTDAIRASLSVVCGFQGLAVACYLLGARTLSSDLARAATEPAAR